jgi:hypothetical protein
MRGQPAPRLGGIRLDDSDLPQVCRAMPNLAPGLCIRPEDREAANEGLGDWPSGRNRLCCLGTVVLSKIGRHANESLTADRHSSDKKEGCELSN